MKENNPKNSITFERIWIPKNKFKLFRDWLAENYSCMIYEKRCLEKGWKKEEIEEVYKIIDGIIK